MKQPVQGKGLTIRPGQEVQAHPLQLRARRARTCAGRAAWRTELHELA